VWSITTRVESIRRRSLSVDLAVFLYLFGTGTAVLFSVGWAMAPFENTEPNTAHDAALVGLAVTALATGGAMGASRLARRLVERSHPAPRVRGEPRHLGACSPAMTG
jgi:hypothetical protein